LATAVGRHLALVGFMGAGKTTIGREVAARLGRGFRDIDAELEESGESVAAVFEKRGEPAFRELEAASVRDALSETEPLVVSLGGGAVTTPLVRDLLRARAFAVLLDVDVETAWSRAGGTGRPLARDEEDFRRLYEERRPLYGDVADAVATDADGVVLAAAAVRVEGGALDRLPERVSGPAEVVSDERVLELHRPPLEAPIHVVPQGEDAKTAENVARLWSDLRLDRAGTLVAVGGGCVTDVTGFAAATYLRGIDWIAVPTTLVGQVDAAIGGKTAINLPEGKNLVGAFHWPRATLIDPELLITLPDEQRREGMAEVVKTGLLAGEPLWDLTDAELVRRCAAFKTSLCIRDPHDRGPRHVLNLGHTFAHALEAGSHGAMTHGRAVALGLLAALKLSGKPTDAVEQILGPGPVRADRERAWTALQRDKKSTGDELMLVLLADDGGYTAGVPEADVRRALDELIAD
jgi:shikimate kinase/3-dehydroquinate synthase